MSIIGKKCITKKKDASARKKKLVGTKTKKQSEIKPKTMQCCNFLVSLYLHPA